GSGDTVFNLDSDTNIQYALSGTSGAITYLTGSYGSGATLAAAASLTGLSLDLSTNVTADAGGNGITGLLLTIPNGGAGTTYGIDIQGASDNGVRIAGATTDITTGTNEALTITANGTGDITLAGDSDTDVIFSGGTTDITTGTNEALTIQPAGTGDTIFNIDADTNLQITATAAPTVDMVSLTNGSFGTTTNNVDALGINIATTSDGGADTNYGISVTIDNTAQDANDTIGGLTVIGAANTVSSTTQRYIDINAPSGNTNGTVVGVYIGSIGTPGAASEYGIRFGSGWDEDLVSTSGNLNISATSTGDIVFDTDADTDVRVTSSAGDTLLKVFRPNDITTSAFLRFDQDTAGGKEWDIGLFANDSGGDLYIQGYDDTAVQTRLVIDRPTGNVSIGGDTSPESLLDLEFATAGGLAFTIENGTTNLLGARYTAANFGLALNAGAFIDRNSTIQEEFYKVQNGGTADTSGVAGAGVGDGGGWGFYEGGGTPDCNIFNLGDVANGILRILSQTSADNGCLVMVDSAANNAQLILDADFLPVLLMKVSATVTGVNNVLFAGMADATDGANTDPANFIGFTNNGGSTWTGRTTSASTSTNVACTGNAISTVDGVYALLMVEVRSTTNVRFFVDPNTSDGISFSECGSGSSTNIPTAALAPELIYQVRTGGTDTTRLDVDFFRAWQDDTLAEGTASALDLRQVEMDLTGRSSIAQFFPADNPHLPEGNLVSLYDADGSVKVRLTEKAADPNMVGIVVRDPGLDIANNTFDGVRVAIGGRALVRVSAENGAVAIGDYLTSSSTPGVAIKATGKGMVIGKALSAFARSSELGALGLIPVFINLTYYDPASATVVQGSDAGGLFANLNASGLTTLERLVVTGPTVLQDTLIVYGTATFEKEVSVKGVLTVGTEAEPKGVTLYDTVTREPYCIMITQGEFAKHRGLCGTVEHQEEVDLPTPQATPTQVAVPPVISISDKEENAVEPPQAFPTTTPESTGEPESIPPPLDVEAASLN
ncbi:MAG: hypothetical protein HY459_01140, partial [Parcubacteria group bacterium]|nr:hypothetical protein [Parcubacteria group bacterium]